MKIGKLEIRNIVATGNFYRHIDTLSLIGKFEHVERTNINSTRVIIRLVDMAQYGDEFKSTFTLFESGKTNYMGSKSIEALVANTLYLMRKLIDNDITFDRVVEMRIVNIVFTTDVHLEINLDELAMFLSNVEYDPEVFPGIVYRVSGMRAVILVFSNGKLVVVGTIRRETAEKIVKEFEKEISEMLMTL